jgi:Zn-finger nucleic acid-binding protein
MSPLCDHSLDDYFKDEEEAKSCPTCRQPIAAKDLTAGTEIKSAASFHKMKKETKEAEEAALAKKNFFSSSSSSSSSSSKESKKKKETVEDDRPGHVNGVFLPSTKLAAIVERLKNIQEQDASLKTVIFSQFTLVSITILVICTLLLMDGMV